MLKINAKMSGNYPFSRDPCTIQDASRCPQKPDHCHPVQGLYRTHFTESWIPAFELVAKSIKASNHEGHEEH